VGHEDIRTLQLGINWLPEQGGNGLDRVFYALIQHLPGVGVGADGLVVGSERVARETNRQVVAFAPDSLALPKRLRALRRVMRREVDLGRYDLVASHFALYAFPVLQQLKRRPLVVHFHGPWAWESQVEGESMLKVKAKAALERAVYRQGGRLIVLSMAFRGVLQRNYGIPEDRVRIVQGGVSVDRFDTGLSRREARARLGWPQDRPTVFCVRRLSRRMGLENLIAAMEAVRERVPEALLHVAGKGPLAETLEEHVRAAGLDEHVRLLGFVPDEDLPLAYRAADVSVVPTVALEGFGLITVESLAAGTPVIVTPVGGLPEVVEDLSDRLVLPDLEVGTLGAYLSDALRGDVALPTADACQAYARARFDWPVIAGQVRRVYEEVLQ
jgi:glycosyltransferase involved in cell wall biosynthesis